MIVVTNSETSKRVDKYQVSNTAIEIAVRKAARGLVSADLGGGVIKQRIARGNRGASRGCRGIFIVHSSDLFLFVDIFAKSEKENLTARELDVFTNLAPIFQKLSQAELLKLAKDNDWKVETYGP